MLTFDHTSVKIVHTKSKNVSISIHKIKFARKIRWRRDYEFTGTSIIVLTCVRIGCNGIFKKRSQEKIHEISPKIY